MKLDHFQALGVDNLLPRDVDIWLPPQYTQNPDQRFPVLYMHDGQNLFEPEKAYTGVTWGVAEAVSSLSQAGEIKPAIIVGIWNTPNRVGDYMPYKPFETPEGETFLEEVKAHPEMGEQQYLADTYLKLIVEVIKPMVDEKYRTLPSVENTFVMGSSMGGLISLYAICEYPRVFGGAGCVSSHWPIVEEVIEPYLKLHLPSPENHKIYFDHGTEGLDAEYPESQLGIDQLMKEKGFIDGQNWITRVFEGATHHEQSWQDRIDVPLKFLLGK